MNIRYVISRLGLLFVVLSAFMWSIAAVFFLVQLLTNHPVDPDAGPAFLLSGGIGVVVGLALWLAYRRGSRLLGRREALLLVGASWMFGAAISALPFFIWAQLSDKESAAQFHSFIDGYFEAMSGLTTTGATILSDIESIPPSLLFWRATTHWLGGLGIVVLFVAILPSLGVGGKKLFRVEAPGPTPEGLQPRIVEAVRVLLLIYAGMTIAAILALRLTGAMGWFDSVCHAFSMVSTGGLSTRDASIAAFDSVAVDLICIVFMLLAGVNFGLFYLVARGRGREALRDTELRVFLALKVIVIAIVAVNLLNHQIVTTTGETLAPANVGTALQYSTFQTVALHTGTGFVTADYDPWPFLSRVLIVGLMFVGGCAGSTAGGIKVIRLWITLKVMAAELERVFRPNVVRPVRIGRGVVDRDEAESAVVYFLALLLLFAIGAFLIAEFEGQAGRVDFQTSMSASVSTLCNVGPGLHGVGATENYGWFTGASKVVMSMLMMLGRLEVFAILVLFTPRYWRGD